MSIGSDTSDLTFSFITFFVVLTYISQSNNKQGGGMSGWMDGYITCRKVYFSLRV